MCGRIFHLFALLCACACILPGAFLNGAPSAIAASVSQSGALAQDSQLGRIYVAEPADNTVLVLAAADLRFLAVIKVPPTPTAVAVDPSRHRVYVASDGAGAISVFDGRSYRLLSRLVIGGHPAGIAVTAGGQALLVTDKGNGSMFRMAALPTLGPPTQVLSLGPDDPQNVLLAPRSVEVGHRSLVWARGFRSQEPVNLYWGVHFLKRTVADTAGFVLTKITAPAKVGPGTYLLIVMGQQSAHSVSTVITVIPIPIPPKHVVVVKRPNPMMATVRRLLVPHLVLVLPALPAVGPLKAVPHLRQQPAIPAFPIEVLLLMACSMLILRTGRRRRKRARERAARKPPPKTRARARPKAPVQTLRRAS